MRLDAALADAHGAGRTGDVNVLPDAQRERFALTVRQRAQSDFEPRQRLAALGPAIRPGRRIAGQIVERIGVVIIDRSQIDEVAAVPPTSAATVLDAVLQDAMEQRRPFSGSRWP